MKMPVLFLCILTVVLSFVSLPVSATTAADETSPEEIALVDVSDRGLGDLAAWQLETGLGTITLYCPVGVNSNGLVIMDDSLVNLTNSTVYFYCPEFPDYTFSASRFSPVYYRVDNYTSRLLDTSSVVRLSINPSDYYDYAAAFALLAIFLVSVWGCLKK